MAFVEVPNLLLTEKMCTETLCRIFFQRGSVKLNHTLDTRFLYQTIANFGVYNISWRRESHSSTISEIRGKLKSFRPHAMTTRLRFAVNNLYYNYIINPCINVHVSSPGYNY